MKNNGVKKSTLRLAVCSVAAAACTALMMFTALIPVGTYALPCFCGMLISVVTAEYGTKWAFGVYAAVSVLSFVLSGDKEAAAFFIIIFGYYPILKNIFERKIKLRILRIFLKLAVFNAAAVAAFFVTTLLLAIPADEYTVMGFYVPWAFLIAGNVFFLIYDFAVSSLIMLYFRKIRNKLFGRLG